MGSRWVRPTLIELTSRKKKFAESAPPRIRSNFIEWNRNAELYAFGVRLSEPFDKSILDQAFTHKSYVIEEIEKQKKLGIENPDIQIKDNEELVQEGKNMVPKIVESYLGHAIPYAPHECIMAFQKYLTSTEVLAKVSSSMGTTDLIQCSTYPVPQEILADVFYALVSALKKSADMHRASCMVRDFLVAVLVEKDIIEIWCPEKPLELLNNILEREKKGPADPRLVAKAGVNTLLASYQVAIYSDKTLLGIGVGNTIDEARNMAALNSLLRRFHLLDYDEPLRPNLPVKKALDEPISNLPLNKWCESDLRF